MYIYFVGGYAGCNVDHVDCSSIAKIFVFSRFCLLTCRSVVCCKGETLEHIKLTVHHWLSMTG